MKIINAENQNFNILSERLASQIKSKFIPDVIVGVANGGAFLAKEVRENFDVPLVIIKRQRNGTKIKNKLFLRRILFRSPLFIIDFLRKVEVVFYELKYELKGRCLTSREVIFISGEIELLNISKNILLIDDTIDSGATLKDAMAFIKKHANNTARIKTACINLTFHNPAVRPDFFLFKRCLIRYPWSLDSRSNGEKNNI